MLYTFYIVLYFGILQIAYPPEHLSIFRFLAKFHEEFKGLQATRILRISSMVDIKICIHSFFFLFLSEKADVWMWQVPPTFISMIMASVRMWKES